MNKSNEQPSPETTAALRDQSRSLDLELPILPDIASERTQYPLDQAFKFAEEIRRAFPLTDRQRELREQMRCTEEFIL